MRSRLAKIALTLSTLSVTFACTRGTKEEGATPPAAFANYSHDVKPLLENRCVACHADGQVAFSLTGYPAVMEKRSAVVDAVTASRMPVWQAEAGHQHYRDDPTFSDEEKAVFSSWAAGDFAEGDESQPAPPAGGAALRDLDADLMLPIHPTIAGYTPNQAMKDEYRCFVIDWPETMQKYLTGLEAVPGNTAIVHHLVVYHANIDLVPMLRDLDGEEAGEGYRCFGGALPDRLGDDAVLARMEKKYPGVLKQHGWNSTWLGHWAPGMRGNWLPEGTGMPIPAGGALVVQVHYYTKNAPNTADAGGEVRFKLADSVKKPGFVIPLSNDQWLDAHNNKSLVVPAGKELTVSYGVSLDKIMRLGQMRVGLPMDAASIEINSANLHMHSFGKSAVTYLEDEDGHQDILLNIPTWNLNWQRDYTFAEPKVFPAAAAKKTSLVVKCTFANPTDKDVFGGFSSDDEMCFNFAFITLAPK